MKHLVNSKLNVPQNENELDKKKAMFFNNNRSTIKRLCIEHKDKLGCLKIYVDKNFQIIDKLISFEKFKNFNEKKINKSFNFIKSKTDIIFPAELKECFFAYYEILWDDFTKWPIKENILIWQTSDYSMFKYR